jgi:hypothetical protein
MPQTKHQVQRRTLPDAERHGRIYLFKRTSVLRATYQIRILAEQAARSGLRLVLRVPRGCRLAPDLVALRRSARTAGRRSSDRRACRSLPAVAV